MSLRSLLNPRKSVVFRAGNRVLVYASLFLLCALLISVPTRAETRRVDDISFSRVLVMGDVEVEITQGDDTELQIRGSSDDLEKQPFFLDGDTLVLGHDRGNEHKFRNLKFRLRVVEIEQLQLTGSGEVYVKPLVAEDLYVSVDGSGDLKLYGVRGRNLSAVVSGSGEMQAVELHGSRVKIVVSGSGEAYIGQLTADRVDASLAGSGDIAVEEGSETDHLKLNIAGSGDVDMKNLQARAVTVNIAGSGDAMVSALDALEVNIVGSGDVYYYGDPEVSTSVIGSGDVTRK